MKYNFVLFILMFMWFFGCSGNVIDSLNGQSSLFWQEGLYKQNLRQWVGYDIDKMLKHSDFFHGRYSKLSLSPHISFYVIQTSIWFYTQPGVYTTNEFTCHVFTTTNGKIVSVVFPNNTNK